MKNYIITCVFLILVLNLQAQDSTTFIKKISNNKIEVYTKNKTSILHTESTKNSFREITVAPGGESVALIERLIDTNGGVKNSMKVYSKNGKLVQTIKDVQKYKWNNTGDNVALILGDYYEGGIGFVAKEIVIYNLKKETQENINIKAKEEGVFELAWNSGNTKLYINTLRDRIVYEYDLETKSLKETNLKGIYFSPDGKYYYSNRYFTTNRELLIYDAMTNKQIILDSMLNTQNNLNDFVFGTLIGWAPNKEHILMFKFVEKDRKYIDKIVQEKTATKQKVVLRDYISVKVTGVVYNFFDVKLNCEDYTIYIPGSEDNIVDPNAVIW